MTWRGWGSTFNDPLYIYHNPKPEGASTYNHLNLPFPLQIEISANYKPHKAPGFWWLSHSEWLIHAVGDVALPRVCFSHHLRLNMITPFNKTYNPYTVLHVAFWKYQCQKFVIRYKKMKIWWLHKGMIAAVFFALLPLCGSYCLSFTHHLLSNQDKPTHTLHMYV